MSLFSRHTTNYSMVHIPPYWETGLVGWQCHDALEERSSGNSVVAFALSPSLEAYCSKYTLFWSA